MKQTIFSFLDKYIIIPSLEKESSKKEDTTTFFNFGFSDLPLFK